MEVFHRGGCHIGGNNTQFFAIFLVDLKYENNSKSPNKRPTVRGFTWRRNHVTSWIWCIIQTTGSAISSYRRQAKCPCPSTAVCGKTIGI